MAWSNSYRVPSTAINEGIWAFDIGACLFGIPIHLHYTLFLFLFIEVFAAGLSYAEKKFVLLLIVLLGPILIVTVLLHELGHVFMTRRLGGDVDQIVLWPLGGYTLCRPTNGKVADDLWIAVMGPVMHIPQAIAWVGVYAALTQGDFSQFLKAVNLEERRASGIDEFASIMAVQAVVMNAALFIINLAIPAYPLDGGRCLAVLMVMAGFSAKASAIITAIFAILIALSGVFYGTYLYVVEKSGSGVIIALIAMLICYSSLELWKAAACGRIHDHPLFDRECYKMNRQNSNAKPALTPSVHSNML